MHSEPSLAGAARQAWVGQRLERLEDDALLNGRGAYADDLGTRPGTLHAAVLRSPHPHADSWRFTRRQRWHYLVCGQS